MNKFARVNSLSAKRFFALQMIDEAAGQTRLRFITDVPGQQAVYLMKLAEAREYLAARQLNPLARPGAHLVAEAEAFKTTALAVAENVAQLGAQWSNELSPAIESARLAAKAVVATAESEAAMLQAVDAARAAFRAVAPKSSSEDKRD